MNKYSRQLQIGRVFVRRTSSGRKYAILADFVQCLVTHCLTLFCRLLSPFLRCRTGFFALRKSPFHVAIWYVRHRHTGNLAVRKSLFRPPPSHFSPPVNPKNASPAPLFPLLTPTSSVPSVPLSPFPVVNIFYSLKRINMHSFTSSLSHLLTLSPPHFSLFTSLIFYPFTFKILIFPLPFYPFTLLIFIFSPSCSFPLIVKKYLYSVIFIPIYLFCFHKSINFAEV